MGSSPTVGSCACHYGGMTTPYGLVMNPDVRTVRLCANGCGRAIRADAMQYCSQHCRHGHYRRRVIALWRNGGLPPRPTMLRVLRQHLIDVAGERCQRCGWGTRNPFTGRLPLEVEHADGNWSNDAPNNLIVLCPNCHALTRTFKGANRGKGRPTRGRVIDSASQAGRLRLAELELARRSISRDVRDETL